MLREDPLPSDGKARPRRDLTLCIIDGGMDGGGKVDVEKGTVETVNRREFALCLEMVVDLIVDRLAAIIGGG